VHDIRFGRSWLVPVLAICLGSIGLATAPEPALTKEQMKVFLAQAKVTASKHTKKGITDPWVLTLTDGKTTHQGVFQAIDEHRPSKQFADGHSEINFVDSYKYNIAAYNLSELLGIDDMIPVYVERKWQGNAGSISWLVSVMMDEQERLDKKLSSPNADAWNRQMYKLRVFDELVYDTDPNLTNVLIGDDWKVWRVDFSRAFRLSKDVQSVKNLDHCERGLFEKLKALDAAELTRRTKDLLSKPEIQALMSRRDKIVAYIQKRIAESGEVSVLY
jgi:hypothetical protein